MIAWFQANVKRCTVRLASHSTVKGKDSPLGILVEALTLYLKPTFTVLKPYSIFEETKDFTAFFF